MSVMAETLAWIGGILGVIYVVGFVFVARRYYAYRHGVGYNYDGSPYTIGHIATAFIGVAWPLAIFSPALRDPQPRTCPDHVLARQQARQQADAYQEALRQERGES